MLRIVRSLYLNPRLFVAAITIVLLLIMSYFMAWLLPFAKLALVVLVVLTITDGILLYSTKKGLLANRILADKLSNSDDNLIKLVVDNRYGLTVDLLIIDEIPAQFQLRDLEFNKRLKPKSKEVIEYNLKPVKRGEYHFGIINIYASNVLGLLARRYQLGDGVMTPVYPSYLQMRAFELLAISNHLTMMGIKKIRRIGHNMEFEQIKEYVAGDDFRSINWNATARRGDLMVNTYQDERSQQVYCIIDKSRSMQMPFGGMTLLDYAINTTLALSNIILKKDDRAGLISFQHKIGVHLKAHGTNKQLNIIMETLYNEKTAFKEADFSQLYVDIKQRISQRSLLILFTNFETLSGMKRQLLYLQRLAKQHVVVVIFFENTEMNAVINEPATSTKAIYHKAIAESLQYEKKLISKELSKHGIHNVISAPKDLSINSINKYLELKSRGFI